MNHYQQFDEISTKESRSLQPDIMDQILAVTLQCYKVGGLTKEQLEFKLARFVVEVYEEPIPQNIWTSNSILSEQFPIINISRDNSLNNSQQGSSEPMQQQESSEAPHQAAQAFGEILPLDTIQHKRESQLNIEKLDNPQIRNSMQLSSSASLQPKPQSHQLVSVKMIQGECIQDQEYLDEVDLLIQQLPLDTSFRLKDALQKE